MTGKKNAIAKQSAKPKKDPHSISERVADKLDPLKEFYRDSFVQHPAHIEAIVKHDTALLVIDMQYLDAAEGFGVFKNADTAGVPHEAQRYYFRTLRETVVPNIQKIQTAFRKHNMEIIHTRIQSLTRDGRDRSAGHKRLNLHAPPGSKEAEFLEKLAPHGDEIIFNKTASGVFPSTNIHYVLNNLGIKALFVTGVYTNECVETTVRAACDLGYMVTVIEDGCTTVTPELHKASLATLRDRYARIMTTEQALRELESHAIKRPSLLDEEIISSVS
ncbi:MAG: isochorismatase family cysteine hydrolase [Verrucomicrobiota bacterium]